MIYDFDTHELYSMHRAAESDAGPGAKTITGPYSPFDYLTPSGGGRQGLANPPQLKGMGYRSPP